MYPMKQALIPLTVTQLNRHVRSWLENDLGEVSVLGELSNLSKPASGHYYFTLKDKSAQLRCVFFRNHHTVDNTLFNDGQQIIATGKLSLYETRGEYQLIVYQLVKAGWGTLYQEFERLKIKLEQLGLFAAERKRSFTRFPSALAVITSGSGAALKDILTTLARRFPIAKVYVYPCEVQGKKAAAQLINAILQANSHNQADIILLARGGGSIEDLWPFNDEQLALTISQSKLPIVSGIGHETDFTIADFVADLRASTPTAAAEAVTSDQNELLRFFKTIEKRIIVAVTRLINHQLMLLMHYRTRLPSPQQIISNQSQTIDYKERQLHQCWQSFFRQHVHQLHSLLAALNAQNPIYLIEKARYHLHYLQEQLLQLLIKKINTLNQRFHQSLTALNALSPLSTLKRGYAIATVNDVILFDQKQVELNSTLQVKLAHGSLTATVIKKEA